MASKAKLSAAIKVAVPTLRQTANELREVAKNVKMAKATQAMLMGTAHRLNTVAYALQGELRAGTSIEWVKQWLGIGGLTIAGYLTAGVAQAIGSDVWDEVKDVVGSVSGVLTDIDIEVVAYETAEYGRAESSLKFTVEGRAEWVEDDDVSGQDRETTGLLTGAVGTFAVGTQPTGGYPSRRQDLTVKAEVAEAKAEAMDATVVTESTGGDNEG